MIEVAILSVLQGVTEFLPISSSGHLVLGKSLLGLGDVGMRLDIFAGLTPSSSDSRFLRRLVRDNQFRKLNPAETLELWPKVLEGERKWIEPFRGNADAVFDSYLVYELAVLKPYVGGLLERARIEVGETQQVMNMIRLLSAVDAVSPNAVPGDSILRETIGGRQLEY